MAIRSDEIISIIKSAIDTFDADAETRNVGTVVEVGDGIAQIYGLQGALASELLEFPGGIMGLALNLEEETVGSVILGDAAGIKEGDTVKTTGRVVEVPVGQALLGRVVDPLGRPIDDKGPIAAKKTRPVERIAPASSSGSRWTPRSRRASRRSTRSFRSAAASASSSSATARQARPRSPSTRSSIKRGRA